MCMSWLTSPGRHRFQLLLKPKAYVSCQSMGCWQLIHIVAINTGSFLHCPKLHSQYVVVSAGFVSCQHLPRACTAPCFDKLLGNQVFCVLVTTASWPHRSLCCQHVDHYIIQTSSHPVFATQSPKFLFIYFEANSVKLGSFVLLSVLAILPIECIIRIWMIP